MSHIAAGFGNMIHDSQHCFRVLLTAMSEPGTLIELNLSQGFGSMMQGSTQVLLTLADNSTPIWLSPQFASDARVTDNLNFHLGGAIVAEQQRAHFALISQQDLRQFDWSQAQFNTGCEEYPDRSATVIVEVQGLSTVSKAVSRLRLSGPGIETESLVSIELSNPELLHDILLTRKSSPFPLGVDFIFVSGQQVLALPRSTTVEMI